MYFSEIIQGFVLLFLLLALCFYVFLKFRYNYWKNLNVPFDEPNLLFGNMKDLYTVKYTEPEVLRQIYDKHKHFKYVGVYHMWKPSILLLDPGLIKKVLVSDFEYFVNHPSLCSTRSTDRILRSLFLMRDGIWKDRRASLSCLFTPKRIRQFYGGVKEQCEKVMPLLEGFAASGEDVELESLLQRYAIDVITSTLFGLDTDAIHNANSVFIECGKLLGNPSLWTVLKTQAFLQAPDFCNRIGLVALDPKIWNFFHGFVREVIAHREARGGNQDDLIGTVLKMKNDPVGDGGKKRSWEMTIEEITGHVYVFFDAGYDTTALVTSFCLFELSRNTEIQDRLREEVDRAVEQSEGNLNYETIQAMTYMDQVVNETLRKYPPVGVLKRECSRDYRLPGTDLRIPKGMTALIPVLSIHHDPDIYPSPQEFDPDRFAGGKQPHAFYPFGKGPRICIGMKLAEMEIKIALSMILRNYELAPSDKVVTPIKFDPKAVFLTIRPVDGLWVKLQHRKDKC